MKNVPIILTPALIARFWAKVEKTEGCWAWRGGYSGAYGTIHLFWHGSRRRGGTQYTARPHRVAYTIAHGGIPDGFYVCHRCDNPQCVRPDHLFLGEPIANTRDMMLKGRARGPAHLDQCQRGHLLTADNVKWDPPRREGCAPTRKCRECDRQRCRDYRKRARLMASS